MFSELDIVVLKQDFDKFNLKKGDTGTIVQVYKKGEAYEVEFVAADGNTVALITLKESDIRHVKNNELLHVREFATA